MATQQKIIALPDGMLETDTTYPKYEDKDQLIKDYNNSTFTMYYTDRFKWCICTLSIGGRSHNGHGQRTYGISLDTKQLVTMGNGPHVLRQATIYVRTSRLAALQKFLNIKLQGQIKAGECRDSISTRRANTRMRRGNW